MLKDSGGGAAEEKKKKKEEAPTLCVGPLNCTLLAATGQTIHYPIHHLLLLFFFLFIRIVLFQLVFVFPSPSREINKLEEKEEEGISPLFQSLLVFIRYLFIFFFLFVSRLGSTRLGLSSGRCNSLPIVVDCSRELSTRAS